MAKQYARIEEPQLAFIAEQRIFFTASAAASSHVNISPRSTDELRVLNPNAVVYRDLTGSGNETAAHALAGGRTTIMFCAFSGAPSILRLYGRARIVPRGDAQYAELLRMHYADTERAGARQMVVLDIDLVQTSCGYAVPFFMYTGERPALDRWAASKGDTGLDDYRLRHNLRSIDGMPTGLTEKRAERDRLLRR